LNCFPAKFSVGYQKLGFFGGNLEILGEHLKFSSLGIPGDRIIFWRLGIPRSSEELVVGLGEGVRIFRSDIFLQAALCMMVASEPVYLAAKIPSGVGSFEYPRRVFVAQAVLVDVPVIGLLPEAELPPCAVSIE
jgi:hypothetical protein